jgi:predicted MFS family arabinose efflux permease
LGVPAFRLLMVSQITSSVGDYFAAVALPWYLLSGGGGPALLGWMLSAYGVSRLVGIAVGGVLADRLGPTVTMLAMDLVRLAAAVALGVAAATTAPTFALLAPIAIVIGLAGGIFLPASLTILPSILDDKDLSGGNALSTIVIQFGGLLGPALGGAVVAAAGTAPAFFVDAGSFLVSALAMTMIVRATRRRSAESADETGQSTAADAASGGVRFVDVLRYGQILRVVLVVGLIGNLVFAGTAEVALPTLAHQEFGARGFGTLLTGVALGLIVGAVLAQRVQTRERPAYLVVGLGALMGLALAAVPFAGGWLGALICLFVFSVGNGWSGTVLITMLQIWTPRALLGRVMSVLTLAINCTFPLSVVLAGVGVGRLGVTPFFVVAGSAIILGVAVALTQPGFRNYRDGDQFEAPGVAGDADAHPGTTSSPDGALSTR